MLTRWQQATYCSRSGLKKVGKKWRSQGKRGTDTGEVRLALGEDRRSNKGRGDGSSSVGDPERGEMGAAGVYVMHEDKGGGHVAGARGRGGACRGREGQKQAENAASESDFDC